MKGQYGIGVASTMVAPAPVREQRAVLGRIGDLHNSIGTLIASIDLLEERLAPVLTIEPPMETPPQEDGATPASCSLAGDIMQATDRVRHCDSRLEKLLRRLEL